MDGANRITCRLKNACRASQSTKATPSTLYAVRGRMPSRKAPFNLRMDPKLLLGDHITDEHAISAAALVIDVNLVGIGRRPIAVEPDLETRRPVNPRAELGLGGIEPDDGCLDGHAPTRSRPTRIQCDTPPRQSRANLNPATAVPNLFFCGWSCVADRRNQSHAAASSCGPPTHYYWQLQTTNVPKTPIEFQDIAVCDAASGTDYLAAKGFVYLETAVRAQRVAIIGTHFQAGKGERERRVRQQQMQQLRAFIDRRVSPMIDVVILAGDLNVDFGSDEYDDVLSMLRAEAPAVCRTKGGNPGTRPRTRSCNQGSPMRHRHMSTTFSSWKGTGTLFGMRSGAGQFGSWPMPMARPSTYPTTTPSWGRSLRRPGDSRPGVARPDRVISHNINARLPQRTV